jgi:SPX domain protein involved in polyphosphate accumulation
VSRAVPPCRDIHSDCRSDNVDYNALKHLLKVHTTRDQGQAVAIPGHVDTALQKFEEQFFNELQNQHDRVELFVTSKADEVNRRLRKDSQSPALII